MPMLSVLTEILAALLLVCPLTARPVAVSVDGGYAWSLMVTSTGAVVGSANQDSWVTTAESMIKPWIAADYLRRLPAGAKPLLRDLDLMLRYSDDAAAERVYRVDGSDAAIYRMIRICGLTHTKVIAGWWSLTTLTSLDALRLGLCLLDTRAAGPTWTPWLLAELRDVQGAISDQHPTEGGGHWGIIDGLNPQTAKQTSIKNGWTRHADGWHVNCLAIHPKFVLAVLLRYPSHYSLNYGAAVCTQIARQLSI